MSCRRVRCACAYMCAHGIVQILFHSIRYDSTSNRIECESYHSQYCLLLPKNYCHTFNTKIFCTIAHLHVNINNWGLQHRRLRMEWTIQWAVHSNLTHSDRLKFKTIAIADVHARDIVDSFVENHIIDGKQFDWLSQLRFHWHRDVDNVSIEHYSGIRYILSIVINFRCWLQFSVWCSHEPICLQ